MPSLAMEPTIHRDEVVTAQTVSGYHGRRGDIVLFVAPAEWREMAGGNVIKRVIATGGEMIECCTADGKLVLDGVPLDEPYLAPSPGPELAFAPLTVPPGELFVAGDNRDHSRDSRDEGFVPESSVFAAVDTG